MYSKTQGKNKLLNRLSNPDNILHWARKCHDNNNNNTPKNKNTFSDYFSSRRIK